MSDLSRVEQLLRNALGEDIYEVTPQSRVEILLAQLNELIEGMGGGSVSPEDIATAVAAYLDEHLTNPTSPPVDTSLSISGAAADAKKTGDEIGDLKEDFANINNIIFYNGTPVLAWEIGSITSNGVDSDITTAIRTASGLYYEFSTGDKIRLSVSADGVQFAVAYYQWHEPSQAYIERGRSSWGTSDVTIGEYTFIRIAVRYSDQRTVEDVSLSNYIVLPNKKERRIERLYGKKVAFTGDSIAYGAGFAGGYGKIIADRNAMEYQNVSVAGATICDTTSIQATNVCIVDTLENIVGTPDYIILEGGCNDASYGVNVGEYRKYRAVPSTPQSFFSYLDELLGTALITFPKSKIGFVISHATQYAFSAADGSVYYDAIVKSCKKWGIPFCDLNTECPPFALFSAEGTPSLYDIRVDNTKDGDGWHPNEAGYRSFYVDKIEAWMESL